MKTYCFSMGLYMKNGYLMIFIILLVIFLLIIFFYFIEECKDIEKLYIAHSLRIGDRCED